MLSIGQSKQAVANEFLEMMPKLTVRLKLDHGEWYEQVLPFAAQVSFTFTKPANAYGYAIFNGEEMWWEETFKGAPFVLPQAGGQVDIDLGKLSLGDYAIQEVLDTIEKQNQQKKPYRPLDAAWESAW